MNAPTDDSATCPSPSMPSSPLSDSPTLSRKRPRLDSSATASSASVPSNHHNTLPHNSPNSATPPLPSRSSASKQKVVLNLRTAKLPPAATNGVAHSHGMASSSGSGSRPDSSPTPFVSVPSNAQRDPSPVDLVLGDTDDASSTSALDLSNPFVSFPLVAGTRTSTESAIRLASTLNGDGSRGIPVEHLAALGAWLKDFTELFVSDLAHFGEIWAMMPSLWKPLLNIFRRLLLSKDSTPRIAASQYAFGSNPRPLTDTLVAYYRFGCLLSLATSKAWSGDTTFVAELQEGQLESFMPHIALMHSVLEWALDSSLWQQMVREFDVDPPHIHSLIADQLAKDEFTTKLVASISSIVTQKTLNMQVPVLFCNTVSALAAVIGRFVDSAGYLDRSAVERAPLLAAITAPQISSIEQGLCRLIASGDAQFDSQALWIICPQWSIVTRAAHLSSTVDAMETHENHTAEVRAGVEKLRVWLLLCWKAMTQSRISLRAGAVHALSHNIDDNGQASTQGTDFALGFVRDNKVVEYILGIDSHAQLVMQASGILSFVVTHGGWNESITKVLISALCQGRDVNKVATIADQVATVAPLMDLNTIIAITHGLEDTAYSIAPFEGGLNLLDATCRATTNSYERILRERATEFVESYLRHAKNASATFKGSALAQYGTRLQQNVHQMGSFLTSADRVELFTKSISHLSVADHTSYAGLIVLNGLLEADHTKAELQEMVQSSSLERHASEFLVSLGARGMTTDALVSFEATLRLLYKVLPHASTDFIESPSCTDLWNTLVANKGPDPVFAAQSWQMLVDLAQTRCQVVARFAQQDLAALSAEFYNAHTVSFAANVAAQMWQEMPQPQEGSIASPPLEDIFWKLILDTPDIDSQGNHDSANIFARDKLCEYFTSCLTNRSWPKSSISATHAATIEKGLSCLRNAAKALRDGSSTSLNKQHFARVLGFLSTFLDRVRKDVSFWTASPRLSAQPDDVLSSDSSQSAFTLSGQPFALKYQASNFEQQSVQVGRQNTYGEVFSLLQSLVSFGSFKTYCKGQTLDLMAEPRSLAVGLELSGLILIQNTGSEREENPKMRGSLTIVESTLLANFDDLYDLLNLEDHGAGFASHDFLTKLPYSHRTAEAILAGRAQPSDCFHETKLFKTSYELESLRSFHRAQKKGSDLAGEFVDKALRFLLGTIAQPSTILIGSNAPQLAWMTHNCLAIIDELLSESPNETAIAALSKEQMTQLTGKLVNVILSTRNLAMAGLTDFVDETAMMSLNLLRACIQHTEIAWDVLVQHEFVNDMFAWVLVGSSAHNVSERCAPIVRDIFHAISNSSSSLAVDRQRKAYQALMQVFKSCVDSNVVPAELIGLLCSDILPQLGRVDALKDEIGGDISQLLQMMVPVQQRMDLDRSTADRLIYGLAECAIAAMSADLLPKDLYDDESLRQQIFEGILFPECNAATTNKNQDLSMQRIVPVIDSAARGKLVQLLLGLCTESASVSSLIRGAMSLTQDESDRMKPNWGSGQDLLRSSTGYSGLRNLLNTCYMNSLVAQLFMNARFRNFVLELPTNSASTPLVKSFQDLFANMLFSHHKFSDTQDFADNIKPYDGEQLDVSIQMDVDEFFNLLLDRLEAQLPSNEHKDMLKNMLGGSLLTQIKSKDCEHISERTEPYLTLSCDVRGKATLDQSLQAYVEGDTMEGENKYKCESCGGRFVDAVKRTCLKTVPDNMTVHLKRFDFDLQTMTRSKINDRFEFPFSIDMAPYKYDAQDRGIEGPAPNPDVFDLVGVLVHIGSAESGHYYSFIRHPKSDDSWLEFNDVDVSEVDRIKIMNEGYGASWEYDTFAAKANSAYMLFYERRAPAVSQVEAQASLNPELLIKMQDGVRELNGSVARWHCLLDPSYAFFVRDSARLWTKLVEQEHIHAHGSASLGDSATIAEARSNIVSLCLEYVSEVALRDKDSTLFNLVWPSTSKLMLADDNSVFEALKWLCDKDHTASLGHLILEIANLEIRQKVADFILRLLKAMRDTPSMTPVRYGASLAGHDGSDALNPDDGILPHLLMALQRVGREIIRQHKTWAQYFGLLEGIARLGEGELNVVMDHEVLRFALLLEYAATDVHIPGRLDLNGFWRSNTVLARRAKCFFSLASNVRLLAYLLHQGSLANLVSNEERALLSIHPEANGSEFFATLFMVLDHTNDNDEGDPSPPEVVIDHLLGINPSKRVEATIAKTIVFLVEDRTPPQFRRVVLNTIRYFLAHCSTSESSDEIWRMLFQIHRQLSPEQALAYTELLIDVAQLTSVPAKDTAHGNPPFLARTLQLAVPVSYMLLSCERQVQDRAFDFVTLAITPLFTALQSGRNPTELDLCREKAAAQMMTECGRLSNKLMDRSVPRKRLDMAYNTIDLVWKWFNQMVQRSTVRDGWEDAEIDCNLLLREGHAVLDGLRNYHPADDDYEAIEEEDEDEDDDDAATLNSTGERSELDDV